VLCDLLQDPDFDVSLVAASMPRPGGIEGGAGGEGQEGGVEGKGGACALQLRLQSEQLGCSTTMTMLFQTRSGA
jgi:hypothetical protein